MPSDPKVWIVLILVVGIVVAIAVWLGRGLSARAGNIAVSLPGKKEPDQVSVAHKARLDDVEVGNITGQQRAGQSVPSSSPANIDILRESSVRHAKIGDIVGVKEDYKAGDQGATRRTDADGK